MWNSRFKLTISNVRTLGVGDEIILTEKKTGNYLRVAAPQEIVYARRHLVEHGPVADYAF